MKPELRKTQSQLLKDSSHVHCLSEGSLSSTPSPFSQNYAVDMVHG